MSEISPRRALDHDFSIEVSGDDALSAYLDDAYSALPRCASAAHRYTIVRTLHHYEVALDGVTIATVASRSIVITELVHALNSHATSSWDGVVCHAGGVARGVTGFVFPAQMEWGKTTLTTGLVQAGFDYLSDEAVAFVPGTGVIEPYPKPLSLDRGSWPLFPRLDPRLRLGDEPDQWHVAPDAIRANAVAGPCRAAVIAFALYQPGATTELVAVSKGEALVEMAKNTFRFREQGRRALDALADVVRGAECFRFPIGDLDAACEVIGALADRIASGTPA